MKLIFKKFHQDTNVKTFWFDKNDHLVFMIWFFLICSILSFIFVKKKEQTYFQHN